MPGALADGYATAGFAPMGALALTNVPVGDESVPESLPLPVVSTGALALTSGDPDVPVEADVTAMTVVVGSAGVAGTADDPTPLGLWVATGALALTNVPVGDEPVPESLPLPVVSTGALALTAGDPDVPVEPDVSGRTGVVGLVRLGKDTGAMA